MTETTGGRRGGGRAARQAARAVSDAVSVPYITRALTPFEVLSEEHLSLIEENADTILEQVGIEFRDTPEALQPVRARRARRSTASASGSRAVLRGTSCRQRHRHDSRRWHGTRSTTSRSAAPSTVFAPAYGSPFVRDLDNGRRYGTIEDFRNFVKLTYHDAVPAPLGRHRLRARRPARQQAALRHGLRAHAVLRQGVHGLGHAPEPGARTPSRWPGSSSAATSSRRTR